MPKTLARLTHRRGQVLDVTSDEAPFGVGEPPPELERLNWGAILTPILWAFSHGLWRWLGALLALNAAIRVFSVMLNRAAAPTPAVSVVLGLVAGIANWALVAAFAFRANTLVWARERQRIERGAEVFGAESFSTAANYLKSQRTWIPIGWFLVLVRMAVTFVDPTPRRPLTLATVLPELLLDVSVLLLLLMIDRRRRIHAAS